MNEIRFYQKKWFTFLMLFVFAPVGIFLLWKNKHYSNNKSLILTIIFGLIFISVINTGDKIETNKKFIKEVESINTPEPEKSQEPTPIVTTSPTVAPSPTPTSTPAPKKDIILGSGNYFAGTDFPAGTYDITALSGGGNVMSSNSFNGGINAVMGTNDNDIYDIYEKEYKNIRLPKGTELKVMSVKIKLSPK